MVDYNFKAFYILFRITPVAECNARLETIYAVLKKSCRKIQTKNWSTPFRVYWFAESLRWIVVPTFSLNCWISHLSILLKYGIFANFFTVLWIFLALLSFWADEFLLLLELVACLRRIVVQILLKFFPVNTDIFLHV